MNERLKQLRKALDLTQQAFAESIGMTANNLTNYETGRRNPSSSVINNICKTFSVSEEWLRTGKGPMFIRQRQEDEIERFCKDITTGNPDFRRRFISALAKLSPEQWSMLEAFARMLAEEPDQSAEEKPSEWTPEMAHAELDRQLQEQKIQADDQSASGAGSSGAV